MKINRIKDFKKVIEQDKKYVLIKIMIDFWDKEIDFNIIKAVAIKKKFEKIEISKLGLNCQCFLKNCLKSSIMEICHWNKKQDVFKFF